MGSLLEHGGVRRRFDALRRSAARRRRCGNWTRFAMAGAFDVRLLGIRGHYPQRGDSLLFAWGMLVEAFVTDARRSCISDGF